MPEKKPPRKTILPGVETAVLSKSARRCCLCYHLNGDLAEKRGQIAHIDGDRSNRAEDNLAWICLDHHSVYDSTTKQHKNYTIAEVKAARDQLTPWLPTVTTCRSMPRCPTRKSTPTGEFCATLTVPSNGSMRFVRTNDFGGIFELNRLDEIQTFYHDRNGPDHELLDRELELLRQTFRKNREVLLVAVASQTYPTKTPGMEQGSG